MIAVSEKKFPTFDMLLEEVGKLKVSSIPDTHAMCQLGTRCIYSRSGELITSLNQFKTGEKYVCCAAPCSKLPLLSFQASPLYGKMSVFETGSNTKTVFVILSGIRPRTIACLLLLKTVGITFETLLTSIGEFLNVDSNLIQNIVTIDDVKVTNVEQFYSDHNSVFVAFTSKTRFVDDLLLSVQEMEFINSTLASQEKEKWEEKEK